MEVYIDGKCLPPTGKDLEKAWKKNQVSCIHFEALFRRRTRFQTTPPFLLEMNELYENKENSVVRQKGKCKNHYLQLFPLFPWLTWWSAGCRVCTDLYFPVRTCTALIPHCWAPPTSFTISSPIMMACQSNEIQKNWCQVNFISAMLHVPLT